MADTPPELLAQFASALGIDAATATPDAVLAMLNTRLGDATKITTERDAAVSEVAKIKNERDAERIDAAISAALGKSPMIQANTLDAMNLMRPLFTVDDRGRVVTKGSDTGEAPGMDAAQFVAGRLGTLRSHWFAPSQGGGAKGGGIAPADHERALGSEILMMGVDPRAIGGLIGSIVPVVSVLRWPEFEPVTEEGGGRTMSIGSGSDQAKAMQHLSQIVGDRNFMDMELKIPNVIGGILSAEMSRHLLAENPVGISPHMHVTTVGVNRFQFMAAKSRHRTLDGSTVELEMPPVAEDYSTLCAILGIDTGSAAGMRA